jgi:hypothetical protein
MSVGGAESIKDKNVAYAVKNALKGILGWIKIMKGNKINQISPTGLIICSGDHNASDKIIEWKQEWCS